jgi:hypothetical protein
MNNFVPLPRTHPDNRLLLDCARTCVESGVAQRVLGSVRDGVDWAYLIETASGHGVLPLLCYNLNRLYAHVLPPGALRDLQARFRANSARNLSLAAELIKILHFLESSGIAALAFKGPALALSAYGNLALRQFGDLDVLVREKDFPAAKELFLAEGYRPWKDLTPQEEALLLRSNHAFTLVRPQDGLRLDLHWRITQERYAFEFDVESLWARAIRVPFCGRDILGLSPEDSLLVLCIHGSKHGWERLGWICDVAEVLRKEPELRWDEILSRSAGLHILRAVLLGLHLAKSLLDAPLPEPIVSAIRGDRGVRWVSYLIQKRLFARSRKVGQLEQAMLFMMARERLQNRMPHLAYSFRRAVTPSELDMGRFSLPDSFYFLYYPLRAMRLTRAAVGRLFGRTQ